MRPDPKSIEIVSHCYSGHCRHYAVFLSLQIESLIRNDVSDGSKVYYTLVTSNDDKDVQEIVDRFHPRLLKAGVITRVIKLDHCQLFRRAIGRNMAALTTRASCVWFTDVDYWFGIGCLESVINSVNRDSLLHTPNRYMINVNHKTGDEIAAKANTFLREAAVSESNPFTHWTVVDRSQYKSTKAPAIGGLQIIGGDHARKFGYLNDHPKWVKPLHKSKLSEGFLSCKCDVRYRGRNKLKTNRIEIPNLFRFRHSVNGRELTLEV